MYLQILFLADKCVSANIIVIAAVFEYEIPIVIHRNIIVIYLVAA